MNFTFPGQIQREVHFHVVSLSLFFQAFLLPSMFPQFNSQSFTKDWKVVFLRIHKWLIKLGATESLHVLCKVTAQVWRTEPWLQYVISFWPCLGPALGWTASLQDNITCHQGQMLPVTLTIHHAHKKGHLQRTIEKLLSSRWVNRFPNKILERSIWVVATLWSSPCFSLRATQHDSEPCSLALVTASKRMKNKILLLFVQAIKISKGSEEESHLVNDESKAERWGLMHILRSITATSYLLLALCLWEIPVYHWWWGGDWPLLVTKKTML